ncbi:unnamed protein product [Fraxinus pennsylvanica]|uniref:Uncharacterized protein n=1 Tax=Fraxinus pennsylvanica TaxID=56036 RepID=A0AAD1ZS01_9LAMI|nr:unnamed protein product [Fraxinus pennsylvanica]
MAEANPSKMLTGNQDFTPKFLQIKQDNNFYFKLLSKDAAGDSSFRMSYYDGAAGSVPFSWESQPGTPKHTFSDSPLPPLTPPPYKFSPNNSMPKKNPKNSKIFYSIIPRVSSKKINISPSFSSSSSRSSSSNSATSTPMNWPSNTPKYSDSSTSAIHFGLYEGQESNSPTSILCFGDRNGSSGKVKRQYNPMKRVKRAFLSIVGQAN